MKAPSLSRRSTDVIDAYWAASFGCPVEALRPKRTLVLPHAAHVQFDGVFAMTFGGHPIVAAPGGWLGELQPAFAPWTAETIRDEASARLALGARFGERIGPAWLGYADAKSLRSVEATATRMLTENDRAAVAQLREACTPLDWEHGGSSLDRDPVAGTFADGLLVALAGYETWGERIAHIAIVAHPAYRGRGFARAAVAAIARHGLSNGLVLQYRTLESNTASRRIADSLGFIHVANSLAIRFSAGAS